MRALWPEPTLLGENVFEVLGLVDHLCGYRLHWPAKSCRGQQNGFNKSVLTTIKGDATAAH